MKNKDHKTLSYFDIRISKNRFTELDDNQV